MYLKHLTGLNYRNLRECDLWLSPKFNCFLGSNGMGKTNVLDAIYYLSFTKSHLNAVDSQLIHHDEARHLTRLFYALQSPQIPYTR